MRDPYEISIWQDKWDENQKTYVEEKIAIIGSDKMTASCRAVEPKLISNINGTNKFSFKMYLLCDKTEDLEDLVQQFIVQNENTGAYEWAGTSEELILAFSSAEVIKDKFFRNPLIPFMFNERKVKVKWQGQWYDLVIKDIKEDSNGKSVTYTCEDQFISELSKNGFNIELDTELENNQGTACELGARVLDQTDWQMVGSNGQVGVISDDGITVEFTGTTVSDFRSDIIRQETDEAIYKVPLTTTITAINSITGTTTTIESSEIDPIAIYYSQVARAIEAPSGTLYNLFPERFQFAYTPADWETEQGKQLVTNFDYYEIQSPVYYSYASGGNTIKFSLDSSNNSKFVEVNLDDFDTQHRADRLIRKQIAVRDPISERYADVYEVTGSSTGASIGDTIYGWEKTEWNTAEAVANLLTSGKEFGNASGWWTGTTYLRGDFNGDGQVDENDALWLQSATTNSNFNQDPAVMPETVYSIEWTNWAFENQAIYLSAYISAPQTYPLKVDSTRPQTLLWPALPSQYEESTGYEAHSYMEFDPQRRLYNTGLQASGTFLREGLQKGQQYRFRYKIYEGTTTDSIIHPSETQVSATNWFTPFIGTIDSQGTLSTGYFTCTNTSQDSAKGWLTCVCTYNSSVGIPREDLTTSSLVVGLNNTTNTTYWVKEIEFYPLYMGKKDGADTEFEPDSVDVQSVQKTKYQFYNHSDEESSPDKDHIRYLYDGYTMPTDYDKDSFQLPDSNIIIKRVYNQDYEKITSITAKESNRFNILQSISENFKCWVEFKVDHNPNTGEIMPNSKYVRFVKTRGRDTGLGFHYGIDLKTISRTIKSDQLTTKTIVKPNSNEFGINGFCTIARSGRNFPKSNFILNFDYYIQKGVLDAEQISHDLYTYSTDSRYIGYYTRLHQLNKTYDDTAASYNQYQLDYTSKEAAYKTYSQQNKALAEEKANEEQSLAQYASETFWGQATYSKIQEYIAKTTSNPLSNDYRQSMVVKMQNYAQTCRDLTTASAMSTMALNALATLKAKIDELESTMKETTASIRALDLEFWKRYSKYILEGTWTSDQYYDDTLYYLDAQQVAYTSSRPQVSYNISVLRVTGVEELRQVVPVQTQGNSDPGQGQSAATKASWEVYQPFKYKEFNVVDIAYVADPEFFGYKEGTNFTEPYREQVLISEITQNFDSPEKDSFKVQNYRTQFEDLFQRITASAQQLQFKEGEYARAASAIDPTGKLSLNTLQESFIDNARFAFSAQNDTIVQDATGITVTDLNAPAKQVKLNSAGLFITADGGATWRQGIRSDGIVTDYLTAGSINAQEIMIVDGNAPTFRWDTNGITAFDTTSSSFLLDKQFVRFNQAGIYGTSQPSLFASKESATSVTNIMDNADFALTWEGFMFRGKNGSAETTIDSSGIRIRQTGGSDVFWADASGNLNLVGKITATSGSIGGFTITSNALYGTYTQNGSKFYTGIFAPTENESILIGAGMTNLEDSQSGSFVLTKEGALVLSSITMKGVFALDGNCTITAGQFNNSIFFNSQMENIILRGPIDLNIGGAGSETTITFTVFNSTPYTTCKMDVTYSNGYANVRTYNTSSWYGWIFLILEDAVNDIEITINPGGSWYSTSGNDCFITDAYVYRAPDNNRYSYSYSFKRTFPNQSGSQSITIPKEYLKKGRFLNFSLGNSSVTFTFNNNIQSKTIGSQEPGMIISPTNNQCTLIHGILKNCKDSSGTAITSDRNKKNSIESIPSQYLTFLANLRPVRYKYNDGTSDRYHTGFIAQEVADALEAAHIDTKDFGGLVIFDRDTDRELWTLRYNDFVALNTMAIQDLRARVARLEQLLPSSNE